MPKNLALVKKLIYDFNSCLDKVVSIHDLSHLFMAYGEIYLRSLSCVHHIDLEYLKEALLNLYCFNNPGILQYMEQVEVFMFIKDFINWEGTEPFNVQFHISIPKENCKEFLTKYPKVSYNLHKDKIIVEQNFNMLVANSIGIVATKDRILKNFMIRFSEPSTITENWLSNFQAQMLDCCNNMMVNVTNIYNDYVDFIDCGVIGMTIFNERAYTIQDFDIYMTNIPFILQLKTSRVIKIDISNLPGIESNAYSSSVFFTKLIYTIGKFADKLIHFEINYPLGLNHNIFIDENTQKELIKIFQRCHILLIRSKFDFGEKHWVINLDSFHNLCRFDIDNLNSNKKIRIHSSVENNKFFSLAVNNDVSTISMHCGLNIIEYKHIYFSQAFCTLIPETLQIIDLEGSITDNIKLNLNKFPKLMKLWLNINGNKKNKMIIYGSQPHNNLYRISINEDVILGSVILTKLTQLNVSSDKIDQNLINSLPISIEDVSYQGNVIGNPIIFTSKYPNLGLIRLLNGMHEKIRVKGNVFNLNGFILVK